MEGNMLVLLQKYWKVLLVVFLVGGAFSSGWWLKTLKDGYDQNIAKTVQQEVRTAMKDIKDQNIQNYKETKEYLQGQQFKVIKEKIPFIVEKEKEIYYQYCMEEKGIDALKIMRENSKLARGMK